MAHRQNQWSGLLDKNKARVTPPWLSPISARFSIVEDGFSAIYVDYRPTEKPLGPGRGWPGPLSACPSLAVRRTPAQVGGPALLRIDLG